MGIFKKLIEKRSEESKNQENQGLSKLLELAGESIDSVTLEQAMNIPALAGCVELISNTIAMLPIKLYEDKNGEISECLNDYRTFLINDETGDLLDGYQFKKAIVTDFLLNGESYTYLKKSKNKIESLFYIDSKDVMVMKGQDPVVKTIDIKIGGAPYRDFEVVRILRKTKDGVKGTGVIKENNLLLTISYLSLQFENQLAKTGGGKRGFLKSKHALEDKAFNKLKEAWKKLYSNNNDNVMVLNDGVEFQEANATSVEMQLHENKITNSKEICKIFNVPSAMLDGVANEEEYNNFIKIAVLPILETIQTAFNRYLLAETEKGRLFFAFDTKELLKGDLEKRFRAYAIAIRQGFMQIDEVRSIENFKPLGLDFIKLGLGDVMYNPVTKNFYTPNTGLTQSLDDSALKGGEKDE